MVLKKWLAHRVSRFLEKRGYALSRPRFHEEQALDLRALLAEPIERAKKPEPLIVVEIGANDGVTNDCVHHLVRQRGWRLFAVEPVPSAFQRLRTNYANCSNVTCLPYAIGAADGQTTIYTLKPSSNGSGVDSKESASEDHLSSFSLDVLRKHWRRIPNLEDRIISQPVEVRCFTTLLREIGAPSIDLLQIDTEGYDYEIIKMAFAAGVVPPILAFEWEHLDKPTMWRARCDLIAHGYQWLVVKGDVVACRNPAASSPARLNAP